MTFQSNLLFYPERISWISAIVLGAGVVFASPFILMLWGSNSAISDVKIVQIQEAKSAPVSIQLGLEDAFPSLPFPDLQDEISYSFDPPRPDGTTCCPYLLVYLKRCGESRRETLPCRLDVQFDRKTLRFAKTPSSFWVEVALAGAGQIESRVFISPFPGEKVEAGRFISQPQGSPIRVAQELPERSPFRLLAEARWWGRDLFRESFGSGIAFERLEIGPFNLTELVEIKEGEWLFWQEGRWQKTVAFPEGKNVPIARIESNSGRNLILEGWDSDGHCRFSLSPAIGPAFKGKGEDLFSFIRIRSEKQVSCMLEKQCLILKVGDWVLKTDGRWKILRKKEERDAFLNGQRNGELFVFERIDLKQGQKFIQGRLFNSSRSLAASVEIPAQSNRKNTKEKSIRKGRL